jgi:ceroid-lipofuscinosis protein 6
LFERYIPFFICLMVYFTYCFQENKNKTKETFSPLEAFLKTNLSVWSALYYWYLVTEGQITPLFVFSLCFMYVVYIYNSIALKRSIDANGKFLLNTFQITIILVALWCYYFWNDADLRKKYTSVIYVPEPWTVYSLHYRKYWDIF